MARKYCTNPVCGIEVVGKGTSILIAYTASALALASPMLNSAGATVKTALTWTGMNFSFMSIVIFGVWLLSAVAGSSERHSSVVLCIISSLGIPGLFLAILAIGKL